MISSQQTDNRAMPNEVHYFRVHVLAILSCFGSWMFGYNVGVIGGTIVLPAFHSDFNLPEVGTTSYNTIVSNIISLFQIGGLCGAMFTFPATKYLGRTVALSITAAIYFVGAALQVIHIHLHLYIIKQPSNRVLQTFSHGKLDMMYTGRLITGLGAGGATVVVPLVSTN
jgi:MFS family permease